VKERSQKQEPGTLQAWILQHSWERLQQYETGWKEQRNGIRHAFGGEAGTIFWGASICKIEKSIKVMAKSPARLM